jgi:methylated-DNA-[protein]-cysteine S-methyltransferase
MESQIQTLSYFSPLGKLQICYTPHGLQAISFIKSSSKKNAGSKVSFKTNKACDRLGKKILKSFDGYFEGKKKQIDLPIDWNAVSVTPFQQAVLKVMHQIPYGQTCSYGELAQAINRPRAFRAVGGVCHRNPLPLLIPCHRVIGKSGKLTGFAWGLKSKSWLIELESSIRQTH